MVDHKKGFTLMELLIVIAIIAILTVSFLPSALKAPAKARDAVRIKQVTDIQAVVEAYVAAKGTIPASVAGNCFTTDDLAKPLGMDTAPLNKSDLSTCGEVDAAATKNLFYYRSVAGKYYIIGSEVEIVTSGNTTLAAATLGGAAPADKEAAKGLIGQTVANGVNYFLAVGPVQ